MTKAVEERERVIIRFAGDSGDGMQLTGGRFTDATAVVGNDLATLPNFPAEIRAPAGTLAGVSAFQIHFASRDILTPGDAPNVLVAMNPAALKVNLDELDRGATIIVNEDAFSKRNLEKAGYEASPLEDGSLEAYRVHRIPMTTLTTRAVEGIEGVTTRDAGRAKNLFALGVLSWLYGRPTDVTKRWIEKKFARTPPVAEANLAAFNAGWSFGETTELLDVQYHVPPATDVAPGTYRNVNGTTALSLRPDRGQRAQRAAAGPGQLPDHPGLGAPARALPPRRDRRVHDPGRGRDRRRRHGARRRVRRPARRHRHQRPRHGPQGRDDRAGRGARAADDHHRRPARRALDRDADQDRAVRSADGPARPPRRVAAAGDRAQHGRRLLRRRVRGGQDRDPLPHAGDRPLRHLPGLVLGAVADPRCRRPARHRSGLRGGGRKRISALHARRAPGAAVGDPRHPGPPAPDRRPGEGRRLGQHLLRRRQPRADDPAAGREGGRHRRRDPAADRRLRAGGQPARAGLGLERGRDPRRRAAGPRGRQQGGLRPAALPEPAARQHPRRAALVRARARARAQQRAAGAGAARPLPGRRRVVLQGPGPAAVRGRDGREIAERLAPDEHAADLRRARIERGRRARSARPTSSQTRRPAGARAAATTPSCPRSSSSCPSWGSRPSGSCSSPASAAPDASPTT